MSDRNYKPSLLPPRLSQKKLYSPRPSSRTGGGFSVLRSGATTILYSQKYVTLYFMVVFLNYFLLMWFIVGIVSDLGNGINGGGVVFWLELIATMLLALEDLLHILSIGALRNFINHQSNVYDTAVIFVSAIVLLITSISDYIKESKKKKKH